MRAALVQEGLGRLRNTHPTIGWVKEERVQLMEEPIIRSGFPDYWGLLTVRSQMEGTGQEGGGAVIGSGSQSGWWRGTAYPSAHGQT